MTALDKSNIRRILLYIQKWFTNKWQEFGNLNFKEEEAETFLFDICEKYNFYNYEVITEANFVLIGIKLDATAEWIYIEILKEESDEFPELFEAL